MEEKWTTVKEDENYEVSSEGRIRNVKTGKILKTSLDTKGYETVKIKENGKQVTKRVGKLVASAFIEDDPDKPYIRYKDGNRLNNRLNNLEHQRFNKKVRVVETGEIYNSISECSQATGLNRTTISKCCNYDFCSNNKGLHFEFVE